MNKSDLRKLTKTEITEELFSNFNRDQAVSKCWRKVEGEWVLKDISFTDQHIHQERRWLFMMKWDV